MSTVVRKGIIELEVRAVKSRLESPQVDAAARAYKEVEKAQQEVVKSTAEVSKKTQESIKVTQEFGFKSVAAFREGGEGALRMARGIALLSASGSDDLQKLIRQVALVQGAFDIFAGGFKAFTNISAVLGGPFTIAIAGVTTALTAGAIAWNRYQAAAERAAKAAAESVKRQVKESQQAIDEFRRNMERGERQIGTTVSERLERERRQTQRRHLEEEQLRLGVAAAEDPLLFQQEVAQRLRRVPTTRAEQQSERDFLRFKAGQHPAGFQEQLREETELHDVLRKRLEVEKDFLRTDVSRAEAQTQGLQVALGMGPLLAQPILTQAAAEAESRLLTFARTTQDYLDEIETAFSAAAERIRKMADTLKDIDAANTK